MRRRLLYILAGCLLNLSLFSQDLGDVLRIINTGFEIAQWVEIASVLTSSEDNLEYWLNQKVEKEIRRKNTVYSSDWLTTIGDRLVAKCDRPYLPNGLTYSFNIIDDNNYNAFAIPGGGIFVTKALFELLNEDEMAFVLGHEIGHIANKHSILAIKKSNAFLAVEKIALKLLKANNDVEQLLSALAITTYITVQAGYSRQWERDVDKYGVNLAYEAGFNPYGGIHALTMVAKATGSWSSSCFLWDTHPAMKERVELINSEIALHDYKDEENSGKSQPLLASSSNDFMSVSDSTMDIIITNEGSSIASNVIGFTDQSVRYKKISQPDGPVRNVLISDILLISFKDGSRRMFNKDYAVLDSIIDVIYKTDGTPIKSQVISILPEDQVIKYKKINQPDGPIRNVRIDDVYMIIYASGEKTYFK